MQAFFQALKAQAAGSTEVVDLRAELLQLVSESPDSIDQAAVAIDAYFRHGVLREDQFRQLQSVLSTYKMTTDVPRTRMRSGGGETPPPANVGPTSLRQAPPPRAASLRDASPPVETRMPESPREVRGPTSVRRGSSSTSPKGPPAPGKAQPAALDAEDGTRIRPADPPSGRRGGADTDQRWEDPHTWTMANDQPLYEGRVLGRHYQLERKIGEGGMGEVWLAKDLVEADFSEKPYLAIKVLKPDFKQHPDALKTLHEEVRRSKLLSHPNIVSVFTFDRDSTTVFMTMEYLDGKPLSHVIEQDFARGMPFDQAWPIIEGVGRALAYAHDRGTIHSDFKPSNVFVMAGGRAKVLDFGIARAMRRGRDNSFDAGSLGALTVEYASCEMLEEQPPDLRDDVYAYGCVVYEMLTGAHVFGGKSAVEARDKKLKAAPIKALTRLQNKALAGALAFDRDRRTGSIEEVIEGLRARAASTQYAPLAAGAAAALIVLGAGGWWVSEKYRDFNEDNTFINSLLKPNAEANTTANPELMADLAGQGHDDMAEARQDFEAGKVTDGEGVLSEGVSTAYGAYQSILRLDPANRPAAEGILAIVKMYEAEAGTLRDQGQFKRADQLVGYALKIDPNRASLLRMKAELDKLASTSANSP